MTTQLRRSSLALAPLFALAACATNPLDAQWSDPQLAAGNPLRGARALVVCEAQDLAVRRVCQDQVGVQLQAAGAVPVSAPDVASGTMAGPPQYLEAAKAANAKALLVTAISPDSSAAKSGLSIGFGLGGGLGGGGFGGIGVSAPIGETKVSTGYAANGSVTDTASGRLVWTARASQAPSGDINAQIAALAKTVVAGATKAGLF